MHTWSEVENHGWKNSQNRTNSNTNPHCRNNFHFQRVFFVGDNRILDVLLGAVNVPSKHNRADGIHQYDKHAHKIITYPNYRIECRGVNFKIDNASAKYVQNDYQIEKSVDIFGQPCSGLEGNGKELQNWRCSGV
jgi:hypothetical protein